MKKRIFAICGSTRLESTNLSFIRAFTGLAIHTFEVAIFDSIVNLPHFIPDLDNEAPPISVVDFRQRLSEADGIVICTPEYAMGVPGSLKNTLDWAVSSSSFSHKPTVLITASLSGVKGHAALLETLKVMEAIIPDELQLVISFAKTKINNDSQITDPATQEALKNLVLMFNKAIEEEQSVRNPEVC
jgi:chromate reductase